MRVYDHPLNSDVTVIEIETSDQSKDYLNNVITGFELFGDTYSSSSLGMAEDNNKKVIYVDGRKKSIFKDDNFDLLCDLTVELALDLTDEDVTIADCISLAEASGNKKLIETLLKKEPEYFSAFNNVRKSA